MAGDSSTLDNRKRETWQPTRTGLVGGQTPGGANIIVVRKLDIKELFIPVVSKLVEYYCQHLDHRVVYTSPPTVGGWMVRVGGNFLQLLEAGGRPNRTPRCVNTSN